MIENRYLSLPGDGSAKVVRITLRAWSAETALGRDLAIVRNLLGY